MWGGGEEISERGGGGWDDTPITVKIFYWC